MCVTAMLHRVYILLNIRKLSELGHKSNNKSNISRHSKYIDKPKKKKQRRRGKETDAMDFSPTSKRASDDSLTKQCSIVSLLEN